MTNPVHVCMCLLYVCVCMCVCALRVLTEYFKMASSDDMVFMVIVPPPLPWLPNILQECSGPQVIMCSLVIPVIAYSEIPPLVTCV